MKFQSILKRINEIPPLPESVQKVEQLFSKGEASIKELVKIVEDDPVLTADILAYVNSPLYSFSKHIVSVHQAVMLFGLSSVRGFILSSAMNKSFTFDMSPYGVTNKEFQELSRLQSTLMFRWYMGISIEDANLLVPIAFLMNIGQVIIAKEVLESDYASEFTRMIQDNESSVSEVEKLFTGMSSSEVTAYLFEQWNFNPVFSKVIKGSSEPFLADEEYRSFCEAVDVVKTCVNIRNPLNDYSYKASRLKVLQYGFNVEKYIQTVKKIQEKRDLAEEK